ncbi:MAG: hypothetical protein AAF677_18390 [Pseudomonadota bacterium]
MGALEQADDPFDIYDELLAPLVARYGPLDEETLVSPHLIFGVSFKTKAEIGLFVTYEPYHLHDTASREGLRFALFVVADAPDQALIDMLTALANHVTEQAIGDGDTADLASLGIEGLPSHRVGLHLFSEGPTGYGLFEVRFMSPDVPG